MRLAGVQKLRCGHEPAAERQQVLLRRLAPLHLVAGHALAPSCATGQKDLQTSHINKPCFLTPPLGASREAVAYHWLTTG